MTENIYKYDIKNEMEVLLEAFFNSYNEPFNCEATFQFNLAMFIKENCNNVDKIIFEENIYNKHPKDRCDLVIYLKKRSGRIFIELKYVVTGIKDVKISSSGARGSFVSDCMRLKELDCNENDKRYCILVSNKSAIVTTGKGSEKECVKFFNNNFKFSLVDKTKYVLKTIEKWELKPENKSDEKIAQFLCIDIKAVDEIKDLCNNCNCNFKTKCKHAVI